MKVKRSKYRVELPEARTGMQVDYGLDNEVSTFGGGDYQSSLSESSLQLNKYLTAVPRAEANLEAEGGETVYGDINGDGIPEHKIIKGPRHSNGGVPLNLPEDTFIFSDTRGMKLKNPDLLQAFGKKGNKSYTPATLAKQYDLDKYRKVLQDPDSDIVDRKTAEMMIRNYNLKLGALALTQEAKKGFPQGIPEVARPYMEANGIQDSDLMDTQLKGLNDQIENRIESEEKQMEEGNPEMEMGDPQMAQEMNQGMPVATPQQGPGMFTGGGMLAEDGMIYAQDGQAMMMQQPQPQQMSQGEDQQIMQLIQAFIQITETSEQEVMQALQSAGSEEEVQALLQQMSQVVQEYMQAEMQEAPMAKYGMAMGGYDMPFVPEMQEMVMQDGGESEELMLANNGKIVIKKSDPDYQRKVSDATRAGKQVFVVGDDGKQRLRSTSRQNMKYDESTMSGYGFPDNDQGHAAAATYYMLEKQLEDDAVSDVLYSEYSNVAGGEDFYRVGKKRKDGTYKVGNAYNKVSNNLKARTKGEMKADFLDMQKRNLMLQASNVHPSLFSNAGNGVQSWDKVKNTIGSMNIKDPQTGEPITNKAEFEAATQYLNDEYGGKIYNAAKKLGVTLPTEGVTRASEQATFHAYNKMIQNAGNGTYNDDQLFAIRNFMGEQQIGTGDENSMEGLYGDKSVMISPVDDYKDLTFDANGNYVSGSVYGNTTAGELTGLQSNVESFADCQCDDENEPYYMAPRADGSCSCDEVVVEEKECICKDADGTERNVGTDPNTGECNPCREDVTTTNIEVDEPAPWWLQDTIKTTGAFGDLMGVKKYMPWAPKADLDVPRPTYLDPTRELAANAEQANIQTQAIGQFAGAQAQSARASSVQGTAAKQAADTLSRVNNQNVNIANEFATNASNIRNQEQLQNQATDQRLYDQTTVANQQFDNAKLAMRNNLRNQFTNAITNRYQTDALNQLYPQYNVDPSVGGKMTFDPSKARQIDGRGAKPTKSYGEYMKECIAEGVPADDKANLKACVSQKMASAGLSSSTVDNSSAAMQQYAGQKQRDGGQMGPGVYANMVFPFIL